MLVEILTSDPDKMRTQSLKLRMSYTLTMSGYHKTRTSSLKVKFEFESLVHEMVFFRRWPGSIFQIRKFHFSPNKV